MIGLRSLAIALLLAAAIAISAAHGGRVLAELGSLSVSACLVLGALAAIGVGLVGAGGALSRPGDAALDLRQLRLVIETPAATRGAPAQAAMVRELPAWLLRGMLGASFLVIGVTALGNHGVLRLRELGADSPPAGRCKDPDPVEVAEEAEAPPPPPPVDQAGCALVRRAYQLGYAKTLGSCAPRQAAPVVARPKVALTPEPCTRRQVDEPFFHYAWRRWSEAAGWLAAVHPVGGTAHRVHEARQKLGSFEALTASSGHALGATPHASHHLWIALPDPEPKGWLGRLLQKPDCAQRYAALPLWPRWRPGQEASLVQHALGQLLFTTRFGTTTACGNYRLHWDAPDDACDRLIAAPEAFLRAQGAWDDVAGVLDRRRRQLEVRALAVRLGAPVPPEPPPASAVVSLQCLSLDRAATKAVVRGRSIALGNGVGSDLLSVRQLRMPKVSTEAEGPIELLAALAQLLAGAQPGRAGTEAVIDEAIDEASRAAEGAATRAAAGASTDATRDAAASPVIGAPAAPSAPSAPVGRAGAPPAPSPPQLLDGPGFALARLEAIEGGDPFGGATWPLRRPDLIDIYPFQRTLFEFIDGFRRRYFAQRGRL